MKTLGINRVTILILMILALGYCQTEKKQKEEKLSMLVTFVTGEVSVIRKAEEKEEKLPAKAGMLVFEKDIVITENGKIDLQMKNGTVIRIREMTSISIENLAKQTGMTTVNMEYGSIIANVRKAGQEEFRVATPTAIAGVRGTFFTVEVDPFEDRSKVQVVEGQVGLKPRVKILEKFGNDERLASDEAAKNLKKLEEQEVVIQSNQSGSLNPELEKKLSVLNKNVDTQQDVETILQSKEYQEVAKMDTAKVAVVTGFEPSAELLVEKETMIILQPEEFDKIQESKDTQQIQDILQQKEQERKINEERILKKIEEEAAKKTLKSEKEIAKHYNKLEVITLRNGRKITGAVIAQTGDILVIHTPKGIVRVDKSEVLSQEFR